MYLGAWVGESVYSKVLVLRVAHCNSSALSPNGPPIPWEAMHPLAITVSGVTVTQ